MLTIRQLDAATTARIADAFRQTLLSHRDVRVRWAAVQTLGENRWLTAQDIKQGLNDETAEIRVTTAFWIPAAMGEWNRGSRPDSQEGLATGSQLTPEQVHTRCVLLATTFLEHLNDNHFYVRQGAAAGFRDIFRERMKLMADTRLGT